MPQRAAPKRKRTKSSSAAALIVGLVLVALGLGVLALGAWSAKLGMETEDWPKVQATITDAWYTVSREHHRAGPVFGHRKDDEFLNIRYAYVVDGRDYVGSALERGGGFQNAGWAREWQRTHSAGDQTTVVVNPADPTEAYLFPGVSTTAKLAGGVGLAFLVVGGWVLVAQARRRAREIQKARNKFESGRPLHPPRPSGRLAPALKPAVYAKDRSSLQLRP
jgi:hypothetical protein